MEQLPKNQLLDTIEKVYDQSSKCKLEATHFSGLSNELNLLSDYFKTSKSESFFVAIVFAHTHKKDGEVTIA